MQAVILAAGKSTRTHPLTLTRPKPLLKIANKTLLEHNLDNLNGIVSEVIIVVGYKKELIKKYIGDKYKNLKIKYVEQKQQLGTAHAVSITKPYIKDRFVLLMGDDVYSMKDIKNCIKHNYSILTAKVKNPQNFGVVTEKNGILVDFIEKPKKLISNLISTAFYSIDKEIFQYINKIKKSKRNEFELPDAVKLLAKKEKIYCINSKKWLPIVYPWDLLKADRMLRRNKNVIGKGSKIHGSVKNSSIGNHCIIKGTVKNSIIMDRTIIDENSDVEDSIIGENVHFKGKIIAKNNAYSIIKNKRIKIDRFGAIIGDNVKAKNVAINPGCKIWPNKGITGAIYKDVQ
ncbi:NTP transferase domain-containing protein [Candidatus Woesearchaeota archaeon]|nr:NTP transferase domain-containing protein [Candidatus Woesearchaeota archaeon]